MDPIQAGYTHIAAIGDVADRTFDTTVYDDYVTNPKVYRVDPESSHWNHVECPKYIRCTGCGHRPGHRNSIVIAVDGGCRNNGTPDAKAAYAAYFSNINTKYNSSSLLAGPVQTSQRAELSAGLLALDLASLIKDLNDPARQYERIQATAKGPEADLGQVVIKSDSEYLVKSMTSWIYKWKQNGFLNTKKKPVLNADLFKAIDRTIGALNDRGVQVQFWHVAREQNTMADYLVNFKLDGVTAEDTTEIIQLWEDREDDEY